MIQRIQSLFLLLALSLSVALFFIPLYSVESLHPINGINPAGFQHIDVTSGIIFIVLNSLTGVFSLVALFLFKNRNLQIRLCNLNMIVISIFIITIFYFNDPSRSNADLAIHYNAGCYFPLVQLLLCFLAMRSIRKDEELVRSADRLR
jgi:peptidoglycan/LPS O-acetylase OafA/YrhL